MAKEDLVKQLAELASTKNKDGSYNRLKKDDKKDDTVATFSKSDEKVLTESFRDEYQVQVPNDPPGFTYEREPGSGYIIPTDIREILSRAYHNGASDIHISVGAPPKMRLHGELYQMPYTFLTKEMTERLLRPLLSEQTSDIFEEDGDLDFAYSIEGACRFRVNMFKQKGSWAAVFRTLSNTIPDADSLGVPRAVQELTKKKRGLVLVTGPTGSGKSTTLASLIKIINQTRRENIITLEDPIEYVHEHMYSTVVQREMGLDSKSFAASIRAALREDPDVILIGEMRDPETIATAVTAAETGHLVFSTLHTIGAAPTIDRIIDSFPEAQQNQVRTQLATVLEGVISQQLIPRAERNGRVAAFEVMLSNPAIRNLIKENKVAQMVSVMQTNRASGMITMDESIRGLYTSGYIDKEKAIEFAVDKAGMESNLF